MRLAARERQHWQLSDKNQPRPCLNPPEKNILSLHGKKSMPYFADTASSRDHIDMERGMLNVRTGYCI